MKIKSTKTYLIEASAEEFGLLWAGIQHLRDNFPSDQKAAEKLYRQFDTAARGGEVNDD